jgi:methyl-accepting chemotaxis protein
MGRRQLSLRARLRLGFGIMLSVLVLMGAFILYAGRDMKIAADQSGVAARGKQSATAIELGVGRQMRAALDYTFTGSDEAYARYGNVKIDLAQQVEQMESALTTDKGRSLMQNVRQQAQEMTAITDKEVSLRKQSRTYEASDLAFSPRAEAVSAEISGTTKQLEQIEDEVGKAADASQQSTQLAARNATVSLVLCGLLAGVVTAILIARSVSAGFSGMLEMVQQIADNNLAMEDLEIRTDDQIGDACQALNRMKNSLRQMIVSISETASRLVTAAEELSATASLQAEGADRHLKEAAEVAGAMEGMNASVQQVSASSGRAAEDSSRAAETARQGGSIVDRTLNKMRAISESVSSTAARVEELGKRSDEIGRIIKVIDEIADQTNLLALNAAIESARAGDQGRGFAVVANEVRKLAERTSAATKEIAQMVANIQTGSQCAVEAMQSGTREVEEGLTTTAQAGDALKQIIQTSEHVGEMITQIAQAASNQSRTSQEINRNMDQIARLVRESTSGAQGSAEACHELSALAVNLTKIVGSFRLEEPGPAPPGADAALFRAAAAGIR